MTKSYLEQEEAKNLEMAATNMRDRLLVRLLSHLGCRVSEALSLTVKDIDLVIRTVRMHHNRKDDIPASNHQISEDRLDESIP